MKRKVYTFDSLDSTDEVVTAFTDLQDRMANEVEALNAEVERLDAKMSKKKKSKKKKGFVMNKVLIAIATLSILIGSVAYGFVQSDINYDIVSNPDSLTRYLTDVLGVAETFVFTPTTAPTTQITEGMMYYDTSASALFLSQDGSTFTQIDMSTGNSLDAAYNQGVAITVDNGAMALTATNAADNTAFQVVQSDTATALGIDINNAGSGNSIDIEGTSGNDIEGTGDTWSITTAGAATLVGVDTTGDITLQNDELIKNDNNGEIEFGNGTEDTAIAWGSNELQWTSDTGVVGVEWGALDSHTGLNALAFDGAVANTISQTGTGAGDDLTISQDGSVDASVHIVSAGTGADAASIQLSAGGLDIDAVDDIIITVASTTTADDLALVQTGANNSSITMAAAGTGDDAIDLNASAGGIDIDAVKSLTLSSTEATDDSIVISAAGTAGGIDITSLGDIDITTTGAAGEDISITNTGGSIAISATEAVADALLIQASAAGGDVNIDSVLGRIEIEAEEDAADAILIIADGGTSSTARIFNDTGTGASATTETDASVQLMSDAGGIGIYTTGNVADAFRLETNGGTSETIVINNLQGTGADAITIGANAAGGDVNIDSVLGRIEIEAEEDVADAVLITADGGTTTTLKIHSDTGTSATEGAASLQITSDVGSINLLSGLNAANAINLVADAGTSETIMIFSDQGTSVTEGAASVNLLSDAGGISIKSTANLAKAIQIVADAGTTETIFIQADQGTGAASIEIVSDAGGVTVTSGTQTTIGGGLIHSGVQDIAAGGTTTVAALTNVVFTVGADAGGDIVTLANGTAGQIAYFICEDASGTVTVTPATFNGGTSITFDALGDSVTLVYGTDLGWSITGGNSYTII